MISSHIASISQGSMSSNILQSSISSSTIMLRSSGSRAGRYGGHNQIRTLRIGIWSSYLEPSLRKEFRRRNKAIKHKYIEAINQKISWDRQNPGLARQFGFKGYMCSAWRGQDSDSGRRWIDMDKMDTNIDRGNKSTSGNEDVQRGSLDKLWEKSSIVNIFRYTPRQVRSAAEMNRIEYELGFQPKPQREPSATGDQTFRGADYEIDPITNRKVLKFKPIEVTRKHIEVPVKIFRGYRSQFQDLQPPEDENAARKSHRPASTDQSDQPTRTDPARDCLQDYEGTETYKPYFAYEPNGEKPDPVQDGLKDFDRQSSYRWTSWFGWKEADVPETPAKACPVQEGLKDYDGRVSYEASQSNTPNITELPTHPDPVQDGLKEFDAIAPYGVVKTCDPGISATPSDVVAGGLHDFDSKTSYGPVLHNEPDGKPPQSQDKDVADDGLRDFDNKADYGQRRILKNISLNQGNSKTDKSFRYQNDIDTREDLDLLRASDVRASSGIIKSVQKESKSEKLARRNELEEDFAKLQELEAFVDTKYTNEAFAKEPFKPVKDASEPTDPLPREARKLTGNFVRDFPEEFQTSWAASEDGSGSLSTKNQADTLAYAKAPKSTGLSHHQDLEIDIQRAEQEYIEGRASKESYARSPETPRLQSSLDRATQHESKKLASHKLQAEIDPYSRTPQGLETSYAEECKIQTEIDPYSKEPQGLETSYAEECSANQVENGAKRTTQAQNNHGADKESLDELFSEVRTIIEEENLDTAASDSSMSSHPIEVDSAHVMKPTLDVPESAEPTVYKILAYDPTMQSISTAETTSIVSDSASALTPAEVLLRLSNPAKFFPHFQPLQEQGYEIISGSGDVLVFRKVRAAGLRGAKSESSSSYQDRTRKTTTTNPIDGMRPIAATGNFASPTGFVNYDRPDPSEPPFKSNIDVRREEPVFSGKSSWSEEPEKSERRKPSLAKRVLVGGAMVGGCSYAIGVVAEYFKSGGIDGLGPQTF